MDTQPLRLFPKTEIRAKEDRKIQFVISDESKDRHGTVIRLGAWNLDNFNKNGIVAYQHETNSWSKNDPDYIIGKGRVWVEENQLIGEVEFETEDINPLAEKIFKKVQFGTLSATSVGFMPTKGHWGKKEAGEDIHTFYFDEVDLLEFSIVNIPSNPNAVKRSFEDFIKEQKANNNNFSKRKLAAARHWLDFHKIRNR